MVYIGYRFIEHEPETFPGPLHGIEALPSAAPRSFPDHPRAVLSGEQGDPWNKGWKTSCGEKECGTRGELSFTTYSDGDALCRSVQEETDQRREFYFEATEDGVCLWMTLTSRIEIAGAFCLQQCLRFTGSTNVDWRQQVAHVPPLSEFDLQARGKPHETLTYVRRDNEWAKFPLPHTCYHTRPGLPLLGDRSGGEIDHGLIVRESPGADLCSGMYWERTAYVSNRHPADCLHASVDLGPLDSGGSRTVHGKVYFLEGTKDDVLELWRGDFPVSGR